MSFINLARLYSTSYRGVEFLYVSGSTVAGRKTAVHEFPQKDFRYVEDLGKNLRSFQISGEISGAFYQTKKKRLEDALNLGGIGVLVHPIYGQVNAVCLSYTLTDDLKEAGIAKFEMTFLEADPNVFPKTTGRTKSIISSIYDSLYDFIENDLKGEFIASLANNILDAGLKIIDIIDLLNGVAATLNTFTSDNKNQFTADAVFITDNAYRLPSDSDALASNLTDFVNIFDQIATTANDRFIVNGKLFGFGSDDLELINTEGFQTNERDTNRGLLNTTVNVLSLTNMYDAAVKILYADDLQLNAIRSALEENYIELINSTYNVITDTTFDELQNLRNNAEKFFEQTLLTVNKVITIDTKTMPVSVLAYQYYGHLDNYDEIVALNDIYNPLQISGTVKVLSI